MLLILRKMKRSYFANKQFRNYLLYALGVDEKPGIAGEAYFACMTVPPAAPKSCRMSVGGVRNVPKGRFMLQTRPLGFAYKING